MLGHFGWLPAQNADPALRGVMMAFGVASAMLYAAGLAFGAESLARTSVSLLNVEEDRYRLLARNMSDVISRHRRNGAVQFISPAAEAVLGTPAARLSATACSTASMSPTARPISRRCRMRRAAAMATASSSACAATADAARTMPCDFIWVEMRCRPLDRVRRRRTPRSLR